MLINLLGLKGLTCSEISVMDDHFTDFRIKNKQAKHRQCCKVLQCFYLAYL